MRAWGDLDSVWDDISKLSLSLFFSLSLSLPHFQILFLVHQIRDRASLHHTITTKRNLSKEIFFFRFLHVLNHHRHLQFFSLSLFLFFSLSLPVSLSISLSCFFQLRQISNPIWYRWNKGSKIEDCLSDQKKYVEIIFWSVILFALNHQFCFLSEMLKSPFPTLCF